MLLSVEHCKTEFERGRRLRAGQEPLWVNDVRCAALDSFLSQGFPTGDADGWEITGVAPIADTMFTLGTVPPDLRRCADIWPSHASGATQLVFVNGHYVPEVSRVEGLPDGAVVASLAAALMAGAVDIATFFGRVAPLARRPFVALNTALFADAACVLIPPRAVVGRPIQLQFISTGDADLQPAMSHPRALVILGDGSRATVVEGHVGRSDVPYLTNATTEVVVGESAVLEHYRLQRESASAYYVSAMYATLGRQATYRLHATSVGAALARTDLFAFLAAPQSACDLNGLCVADGNRVTDLHATIEHAAENCDSRQVSRGILAHRAMGVLDGRIIVPDGVEAGEIHQKHQALLLSPTVVLKSTPAAVATVVGEAADAEARRVTTREFVHESLVSMQPPELAAWFESVVSDVFSKPLRKPGI